VDAARFGSGLAFRHVNSRFSVVFWSFQQMTAKYDKLGLKFLYPENWKLIDDVSGSPQVITLETPDGSSTWSVHLYPCETDVDLILKEAIDSLQQTYEDIEISPCESSFGATPSSGVEALFYCLDFLIRAELQIVKTDEKWLMFWTQAEDRDYDNKKLVFKAIAISLLQSLTPDGA
jgi:hypothetical protein